MDFIVMDRKEIPQMMLTSGGYNNATVMSAKMKEVIDGTPTLELEVAVTLDTTLYVREENIVGFYDELETGWKFFVIKEIAYLDDPQLRTMEVYCEHYSYELIDNICRVELKGDTWSIFSKMERVLEGTRWEVSPDSPDELPYFAFPQETKNKSVLEVLQLIASEYGLHILFEMQYFDGAIQNRYVTMKKEVGTERGVVFDYNHNITSVSRVVSSGDIKTAIIPVGGVPKDSPKDTPPINITGVTWTKPTNPANKPAGQDYLIDDTATNLWGFSDPSGIKIPRYAYYKNDNITNPADLIQDAWNVLQTINTPMINYKTKVIDLFALSGYDYQNDSDLVVRLGDTVTVVDRSFLFDNVVTTHVITREVDLIDVGSTVLELGNHIKSIVSTTSNLSGISSSAGTIAKMGSDILQLTNNVTVLGGDVLLAQTAIIGTARIEDLAVTTAKIGDAQITTAKIADAQITNAKIGALAVDTAKIKDASITTAKIGNLAVDSAKIKDASITNAKIDRASVNKLVVTSADIADAQITTAKIATGAITTALIGTGAIDTAQIADGSITDAKIVGLTANKITAGTIDAGVITVNNLNANNITTGTINGVRIADGAIDASKLTPELVEAINTSSGGNKVFYSTTAPTAESVGDTWFDTDDGNRIYKWDGTAWVAVQFGTNAIANSSITNALIADATIQSAKISALDAGKITTGTLSANRIGADSITVNHLATDSVTADQLAVNSILAEHITAGVITGDKLVADAITAREIATGTITASSGIIASLDASKITTGTLSANFISGGTISGNLISGGTINGVTITGSTLKTNTTNYVSVQGSTIKGYNGTTLALDLGVTINGSYNLPYISFISGLAQGGVTKTIGLSSAGELSASIDNIENPLAVYGALTVSGDITASTNLVKSRTLEVGSSGQCKVSYLGNITAPKVSLTINPAWTTPTLGSGWSQYSGQETFAYYKDGFGFVHFKGSIKGGTFGTDIFVLPSSCHPYSGAVHGAILSDSGGDIFGSVYIGPTGNVRVGKGTNTIMSFDGFSFYAGVV